MHHKVLSSLAGFHPPDARGSPSPPPPNCDNQIGLQALPNVPDAEGVSKLSLVENSCPARTQKGKSILKPVIDTWRNSWMYLEYLNPDKKILTNKSKLLINTKWSFVKFCITTQGVKWVKWGYGG